MVRTVLAALTAVLILPATAQAAFPGANGRIAFNWTFGCDGSVIATMKPNGSDIRRLTADPCTVDGPPRAAYPDYTADGASLLFMLDHRLAMMTADGGSQTLLGVANIPDPARPSVSPSGTRIAYTRIRHNRTTVYTAKLDGSDEKRLQRGYVPRYSPDGRSIAIVKPTRRIVIVRARTGATIRRLHAFGYHVDWAPGGRRLLFADSDEAFVIRADGTGKPRRVLRSDGVLSPVWSPDGKRIAFVKRLPTNEDEVRYGVFTKRLDGVRARRSYRTAVASSEETLEPLTISWQPVVGP